MDSNQSVSPEEIRGLLNILGVSPTQELISKLAADMSFCFAFSAVKSSVSKYDSQHENPLQDSSVADLETPQPEPKTEIKIETPIITEQAIHHDATEDQQTFSGVEFDDDTGQQGSHALPTASDDHAHISLVKLPFAAESPPIKSVLTETQPMHQPEPETLHITLPNGMCGRNYHHGIPVESLHVEDFRIPEEINLQFDRESSQLTGVPEQAGDFDLRFQGYLLSGGESLSKVRQPVFVIARLTINPDPRTLWKDLPSDTTAKFHKPDLASHSMDIGGHRMLAASRRGRSHAHKGTHRDDEAGFRYLPESGWHILAVADGAGSCQYSRRGSQLALDLAILSLKMQLSGERARNIGSAPLAQDHLHGLLIAAAHMAAKGIEDEAKKHGLNIKDFSTTLLLMIYKQTEKGALIATFSVGDGAIAAYSKDDGVHLLSKPDSGEFAGQTRFLEAGIFQSENINKRVKVALRPRFTALMAMTDGITDAKFETETMLSQDEPWHQLWQEIEPNLEGTPKQAEENILEWLNFFVPGNHDDRSIALLAGVNRHE